MNSGLNDPLFPSSVEIDYPVKLIDPSDVIRAVQTVPDTARIQAIASDFVFA